MDLPGGTAGDVSYAYDNFGRLTSAAIAGNTLSFAYDQLSRVTGQTNPRGTTGYQYDLAGRRTRLTHPDGFYVNYDWDLANEAIAVRVNGASSGVGVVANFAWDDLGRRTALARGNGTSTAYGYDGASRLTGLSHDLAGTGADIAWTFGYNPAGQIVSRTASNAAYNGPAPANGTTGYARNGLNQYTAVGAATPTYDARGNITWDGQRAYTFDPLNRLISASGAGTMSWDPVSRLAGIVAGTTVVNLNYDGDDLIDEYLATGMLRRHIFAPGVDEPLLTYEGADTSNPSWLYADPLGSTVGYANASGAATYTTGFDEYGLNNNAGGRFQFTGQAWFPGATGSDIYHYKARTYSSTLGRFLQPDPILYAGGMNLYAYVGNDPVNLRDPWGLDERPPPGGRDYCPDGRPDCDQTVIIPGNIGNFAGLRRGGWSFWRLPHSDGGGGSERDLPQCPSGPYVSAQVGGSVAAALGVISLSGSLQVNFTGPVDSHQRGLVSPVGSQVSVTLQGNFMGGGGLCPSSDDLRHLGSSSSEGLAHLV